MLSEHVSKFALGVRGNNLSKLITNLIIWKHKLLKALINWIFSLIKIPWELSSIFIQI